MFANVAPTGANTDVYSTVGPWIIWPTGPGNTSYMSLNGGGGEGAVYYGGAGGAFSGGGASRNAGSGGKGGYGAGGGAGGSGGNGGQGYVVIEFIPAE